MNPDRPPMTTPVSACELKDGVRYLCRDRYSPDRWQERTADTKSGVYLADDRHGILSTHFDLFIPMEIVAKFALPERNTQ